VSAGRSERVPIEAYARRAKEEKQAPVIPAPTIPQRFLDWDKAARQRTFPLGPKRLWRAALDAGLWVRVTYAVGPLINASGRVLEEKCPSIAVWLRRDEQAIVALWLQRSGKWAFDSARWRRGGHGRLTSAEMTKWVTG